MSKIIVPPPMNLGVLHRLFREYGNESAFMVSAAKRYGLLTAGYARIVLGWHLTQMLLFGKKRKNGDKMFSHECSVAIILMEYLEIDDPALIAAAFMHDHPEDLHFPPQGILIPFGTEVVSIVAPVTKPMREKGMLDSEYSAVCMQKVWEGGPKAILLKCADRLHNMLTLFGDREKMIFKLHQTWEHIIPMAEKIGCLEWELRAATAEQAARLGIRRRGR